MLVVQETTKWDGNTPNHIYFLNTQKNLMYAYINSVTGESKTFKNPIHISSKNRTFELIKKVDWK